MLHRHPCRNRFKERTSLTSRHSLPRIHICVLQQLFLFILSITNKWEMHKPQLVVCWGQNIVLIITSWPRERRKEIRKKGKAGKKEDRERERKKEEGREEGGGRTEEEAEATQGHAITARCAPAYAHSWTEILRLDTHTRTCSLITAAHSKSRHFQHCRGNRSHCSTVTRRWWVIWWRGKSVDRPWNQKTRLRLRCIICNFENLSKLFNLFKSQFSYSVKWE